MTTKIYPPSKDRRDIGQVTFPIEKMMRARELSSGCVGVEAMLQSDRGADGFLTQATNREIVRKNTGG